MLAGRAGGQALETGRDRDRDFHARTIAPINPGEKRESLPKFSYGLVMPEIEKFLELPQDTQRRQIKRLVYETIPDGEVKEAASGIEV